MMTFEMLQIIIESTEKTSKNELMLNLAQTWIDASRGVLSIDVLNSVYNDNHDWFESVLSNQESLGSIIKDIYYYNLGIWDSVDLIPRLENLYQISAVKCAKI